MYDATGFYKKLAPDCHSVAIVEEYCFNTTSKRSSEVTATVQGFHPHSSWEVIIEFI